MSERIDHINIVVSNLKEAQEFFVNILGFSVEVEAALSGSFLDEVVRLRGTKASFVGLSLPDGNTRLELIEYESPVGGVDESMDQANQIGYRHMAIRVKGIDAYYERIKEAGVETFSDLKQWRDKKLFYFLGPDNIILELCEYGFELVEEST